MAFGFFCAIVLFAIAIVLGASSMTTTTTWVITEENEGAGIGSYAACTTEGNDIISATIDVPISTTNLEKPIVFDMADVDQLIIVTTADVTMYTNAASTGSPDDTITLKAGYPFVWFRDSGIPVPIDGNSGAVSSLFFTNASAENAAEIKIRGIQSL